MGEAQPDYIIADLWPLVVGIDEVQIDPSNAMMHDEANLDQIAGSLNKHKQRKPVVINRATGTIEAGNGTLIAARRLGWQYIAVVGEEDDAQTAVSYGIADNAVASQAWDWERLKKHLDTFDEPGEVPGVDDGLLATLKEALAAEELNGKAGGDAPPQVDRAAELQREYGTEVGQIWRLGEHRLAVGDCTDKGVVEGVMGGEKAFLCLTDPPYGIGINSNANCFGVAIEKSRKATNKSWDESPPDKKAFEFIFIFSDEQVIFGANYFWEYFYSSGCYIVWDKRGDLPTVPFSDTEFAWTSFVDKPSKRYVIINHGFIRDEKEERFHPTQKPVKLFYSIIDDFTKNNAIVYDPFLGSGTTLIACENLGRRCRGIEIDPGYAAVTLRRWEELTGGKAERIMDNGHLLSSLVSDGRPRPEGFCEESA